MVEKIDLKWDDRNSVYFPLTPSWQRSLPYRNQSIDLVSKSMDRFLYDTHLCHDRDKHE